MCQFNIAAYHSVSVWGATPGFQLNDCGASLCVSSSVWRSIVCCNIVIQFRMIGVRQCGISVFISMVSSAFVSVVPLWSAASYYRRSSGRHDCVHQYQFRTIGVVVSVVSLCSSAFVWYYQRSSVEGGDIGFYQQQLGIIGCHADCSCATWRSQFDTA